jgi:lipoprotein-releasing system permease protein
MLAAIFARTAKNADGSALFPMALTVQLIAGASVMALLVGVAAAAIPSWRATKLDPAEVIRYG